MANVGVNFGILESLFQVVIDGLVGDLADERQIRDPDLLLLGAFELGFFDLRLPPTPTGRRLRRALVLLAACALCHRLLPGSAGIILQ